MTNEEKQALKARKEELTRAKAKQMAKNREQNGNFFKRTGKAISKWFREMKSELNKVVWPTKQSVRNNTVVSLVMMATSAIVVWGFDTLASYAVKLIIALGG